VSTPEQGWRDAWRALPWSDRRRIAGRVRRGARLVRPEEAALGAWFALRDLRRWPRFVALLGALVWWPALTRLLPASVGGIAAYLWAAGVLAIPVLVWLYLTTYRPALRRALHANLSVAAGSERAGCGACVTTAAAASPDTPPTGGLSTGGLLTCGFASSADKPPVVSVRASPSRVLAVF
jgi:hypothetical protein